MPCTCLQIVVDVAGSFGLQNQELNISLTSIGLLVRKLKFQNFGGFMLLHYLDTVLKLKCIMLNYIIKIDI